MAIFRQKTGKLVRTAIPYFLQAGGFNQELNLFNLHLMVFDVLVLLYRHAQIFTGQTSLIILTFYDM